MTNSSSSSKASDQTVDVSISSPEISNKTHSSQTKVNNSSGNDRVKSSARASRSVQEASRVGNNLGKGNGGGPRKSQLLYSSVSGPNSGIALGMIETRGMVPAIEILLCSPAVRNIIREARTFEIPNVIDTNRQLGMISLDSAIAELYFNGMISREDAIAQSAYPDKLERAIAA